MQKVIGQLKDLKLSVSYTTRAPRQGEIDGKEFYEDISAEADDKENGTYLFIVKKNDTLSYHGCMTILDEEFDLHYVEIHDGEEKYKVNFD